MIDDLASGRSNRIEVYAEDIITVSEIAGGRYIYVSASDTIIVSDGDDSNILGQWASDAITVSEATHHSPIFAEAVDALVVTSLASLTRDANIETSDLVYIHKDEAHRAHVGEAEDEITVDDFGRPVFPEIVTVQDVASCVVVKGCRDRLTIADIATVTSTRHLGTSDTVTVHDFATAYIEADDCDLGGYNPL